MKFLMILIAFAGIGLFGSLSYAEDKNQIYIDVWNRTGNQLFVKARLTDARGPQNFDLGSGTLSSVLYECTKPICTINITLITGPNKIYRKEFTYLNAIIHGDFTTSPEQFSIEYPTKLSNIDPEVTPPQAGNKARIKFTVQRD